MQAEFNQYWYSANTIDALIAEIESTCAGADQRVAFLSTPSVFFSLNDKELQSRSALFDVGM
jgi:EEF1A lysine methyltransferase 1